MFNSEFSNVPHFQHGLAILMVFADKSNLISI